MPRLRTAVCLTLGLLSLPAALRASEVPPSAPGPFYEYETVSQLDTELMALSYPLGPSINDQGRVGFAGHTGITIPYVQSGAAVFVVDEAGRRINVTRSAAFPHTAGNVALNNAGQVLAYSGSELSQLGRILLRGAEMYLLGEEGGADGYISMQAASVWSSDHLEGEDWHFDDIAPWPAMNNRGQYAFLVADRGTRAPDGGPASPGEIIANQVLLVTTRGADYSGGYDEAALDIDVPFDRLHELAPMIADDGRVVVADGLRPDASIRVFEYGLASDRTVARSEMGFTRLGHRPAISDTGKVVAYYGNRGDGDGLFLAVDEGGGFSSAADPIRVVGENAFAPRPELGYGKLVRLFPDPVFGPQYEFHPVHFASLDLEGRLGLVHLERGRAGLADDSVVIAFKGNPSSQSRPNPAAEGADLLFSNEDGLWTVRVDFETHPTTGALAPQPRSAIPVAQVGDILHGARIDSIEIFDPIALAAADASGLARAHQGRGDHRLAFAAQTSIGPIIVRAAHLDTDDDGLLDHWETDGIDMDGDGAVDLDLARLGADPHRKDVFLEIDWVAPRVRGSVQPWANRLQPGVTQRLVDSFAGAPVDNPNGSRGITLHVDAGPGTDEITGQPISRNMHPTLLQGGDIVHPPGLPRRHIELIHFADIGQAVAGVESRTFSTVKDHYFGTSDKRARELAFHYAVLTDFHDTVRDGENRPYVSHVASAESDTLLSTTDLPADIDDAVVIVTNGAAAGQVREIDFAAGREITLEDDWTIRPGPGSQFTLMHNATGRAEIAVLADETMLPGNDLVTSWGSTGVSNGVLGSPYDQWATLLHELGHNFGLGHCGADLDSTLCDEIRAGASALTSGPVIVSEGGLTGHYDLVLNARPSASVTIDIFDGYGQALATPNRVTFTTANWDRPQRITVRGVDDALLDELWEGGTRGHDEIYHGGSLQHTLTSSDRRFHGVYGPELFVRVYDDERPGLIVLRGEDDLLAVAEAGAGDRYDVLLTRRPIADVEVALVTTPPLQTSLDRLVFTPVNWHIPQPVFLSAPDDGTASFGVNNVVHTFAGDPAYSPVAAEVYVRVYDRSAPALLLVATGGNTTVFEGGATDTVLVSLASAPTADVTVELTTDAETSVSPPSVTFTPTRWQTPVPITVTATNDERVAEGLHGSAISASSSSADIGYAGPLAFLDVAVRDDDFDLDPDHRSVMSYAHQVETDPVESYARPGDPLIPEWPRLKLDFFNTFTHIGATPEDFEPDLGMSVGRYIALFGRRPDVEGPEVAVLGLRPGAAAPVSGALDVRIRALDAVTRVAAVTVSIDADGDGVVAAGEKVPAVPISPHVYSARIAALAGGVGARVLSVRAEDLAGNYRMAEVDLSVVPTAENQAPAVSGRVVTTAADTPAAVTLDAVDPESNPVTYEVLIAPANGTLGGTAPHLVYTPNAGFSGFDSLRFRAFDGLAHSSVATVTVMVGAVNEPPALAPVASPVIDEDTTLAVPVTASDADGDAITLGATALPSFATFLDRGDGTGTIHLAPGPSHVGVHGGIEVRASDGRFTSRVALSVTVRAVNLRPVLAPIGHLRGYEGFTVQYAVSATDADGDTLTLSASGLPAFATFSDRGDGTGTLTLSPVAFRDDGVYPGVTLAASDGDLTASETLTITVPGDTGPPEVGRVFPPDGARHLAGLQFIDLAFTEPLDDTALTAAAFDLRDAAGVRRPLVGFEPRMSSQLVTLTFDAVPPGSYTLSVDGTAVRDREGNRMSTGPVIVTRFTLLERPDTAASLFPHRTFRTARGPQALATADLDEDGHLDLVAATLNNELSLLLGNGDGTFREPTGLFGDHTDVALGDINADGHRDIVTASGTGATGAITARLGRSDGTFDAPRETRVAFSVRPTAVAVGDLDGDGRDDVAVGAGNSLRVATSSGDGLFTLRDFRTVSGLDAALGDVNGDGHLDVVTDQVALLGDGDGTLGGSVDLAVGNGGVVAVDDVDHDGDRDVVIAKPTSTLHVVLGNGDGTFAPPTTATLPLTRPGSLGLADLDRDGHLDLAVGDGSGTVDTGIIVLPGRGDGSFGPAVAYPSSPGVHRGLVFGDFDEDGHRDFAHTSSRAGSVAVHLDHGTGPFPIAPDFGAGLDSSHAALGDLDGDGDLDLAVSNRDIFAPAGSVTILRGNGDGTFAAGTSLDVGRAPHFATLVDVDDNDTLDLLTANGIGSVTVRLGAGDGAFGPRVDYPVGARAMRLAHGDLDRDGDLDLVVTVPGSNSVAVLLGAGDGTFSPGVGIGSTLAFSSVALGDVDGDGHLDAAVKLESRPFPAFVPFVGIFRGNGDGTFDPALVRHTVRTEGGEVRLVDLDADGDLDIATSSRNTIVHDGQHVITVLRGAGDGTFPTRTDHPVGSGPVGLAVGRVDDDASLDLVSANLDEDSVTVLLGDGSGGFSGRSEYDVGNAPSSVALGDLNGDGRTDFVTSNEGGSSPSGAGSASPRLRLGLASAGVPVADAGPDQAVAVDTLVALDGTASRAGGDGDLLTYRWTQRSGPAIALTGENTATPSFMPDAIGTYAFELTVTAGGIGVTDSVAITVTGQQDLAISMADGRASVASGQETTYTLRVVNNGSVPAEGVVVRDTLPAGVAVVAASDGGTEAAGVVVWPPFTLARGAEVTRTVMVSAASSWTSGVDSLVNAAVVADDGASGPDPTPADNQASDTNALDAVPDLAVVLSDGREHALPGDTLTYTVTVRNAGPQGATGIALDGTLPARSTLVSASDGGVSAGEHVTWPPFALAAGAIATRTFAVQLDFLWPADLDEVRATAAAGDDDTNGPDPSSADNAAVDVDTVSLPDLRVVQDDGKTVVVPGETVTYVISVHNVGDAPASGVALSDTLPPVADFVSAGDGGTESGGRVTWPPFDLAAGAGVTRSLTVRVRDTVAPDIDVVVNVAKAGDDRTHGPDRVPADNGAVDRNELSRPTDLLLTQSASPEPVAVGAELTYAIEVANVGAARDGNVILRVDLPPDAVVVSAHASRGTCSSLAEVLCLLGPFEPGDTTTVMLRVTPSAAGTLISTAAVTGDEVDPEGGNNRVRTTTTVLETVEPWDFTNETPRSGLGTPGAKAGGLAWCDFDNDGFLDALVNTGTAAVPGGSRLYLNNGDRTFRDATTSHAAGLLRAGAHQSVVCGDLDNDGDNDLVRDDLERVEVYLNGGALAAPPFRLGDPSQTVTGLQPGGLGLLDFDHDGDLDLVVDADDRGLTLLANDGSGRLAADGTRGLPAAAASGDFLAVADHDVDGRIDVLARKQGAPDLWRGAADGTFAAVPSFDQEAGAGNPGGVAFCDFDADGDFDLVWTDAGITRIWRQRAGVFEPTGEPSASAGVGLDADDIDGVACADVDLDGDVDLFLGASSGRSYLFLNRTRPGPDAPLAFVRYNRGIDVGADSEGLAFGDYDRDGDLDLLVNVDGGSNQLWESHRNDASRDGYLAVRALRCAGGAYRDDIGAVVRLFDGDGTTPVGPVMEVNGGQGHGSQDPAFVHLGLPSGPDHDYVVEVRFVGGPTVRRAIVPGSMPGYQRLDVKSCGDANQPPVARDLEFTVTDRPIPITLAATDPEGHPLTYEIVTLPAHGELAGTGAARTYTPRAGFTGDDGFTYRASDGELSSGIAIVHLLGPTPPPPSPFTEIAAAAGVATPGAKEGGLAWCDFDDDGHLDVLVNGRERSYLYFNRGGTFTDVTATHAPGLVTRGLPRSALCGDVDNDGRLDFARNAHDRIEVYLNRGPRASPPWSFGKTPHQKPDRVIEHIPHGMSVEGMGLLDYDADGDLDLVLDNDRFGIALYENNGSGHFHPSTTRHDSRGLPQAARDGDYLAVADYDRDGRVDLAGRKGGQVDLWRNRGGRMFGAVPSLDGEADNANKGGVAFCDFDADGDLDVFWTDAGTSQIWRNDSGTFHATGEPALSAGVDLSRENLDGVACADVDNDGDVDVFVAAASGPSHLFLNETPAGAGAALSFRRAADAVHLGANGEAAAFGDYDRDGDMDLLVNVDGGANQLWANSRGGRDYLMVRAVRCLDGDEGHRDDVGATVRLLDAAGAPVGPLQEVNGGSGHGSQGPLLVHFGLPQGPDRPYVVEVRTVGGSVVRRTVRPSDLGAYQVITIESCPSRRH